MGILKGLVFDRMMGTMEMGKGMMRRMVASQWFKDSYNKARMLLGSGMIAKEYSREFIEKEVGQDIIEDDSTHIQSASQLRVFRVVKHL